MTNALVVDFMFGTSVFFVGSITPYRPKLHFLGFKVSSLIERRPYLLWIASGHVVVHSAYNTHACATRVVEGKE